MVNKFFCILTFLSFLLFSCEEESQTVNISEITVDKTSITVGEIVQLSCKATSSDKLYYHWSLIKENTIYESCIIEKENTNGSFNYGKWIKWSPPSSGTWTIEVIAYISSGDHKSQSTDTWKTFFEYNAYDEIERLHCFNSKEKGELWDELTITKSIGD